MIEPKELDIRLKRGDQIQLVDVREPHELEISSIQGACLIPLGLLTSRLSDLNRTEEVVFFCRTNQRSTHALELLISAGFSDV